MFYFYFVQAYIFMCISNHPLAPINGHLPPTTTTTHNEHNKKTQHIQPEPLSPHQNIHKTKYSTHATAHYRVVAAIKIISLLAENGATKVHDGKKIVIIIIIYIYIYIAVSRNRSSALFATS